MDGPTARCPHCALGFTAGSVERAEVEATRWVYLRHLTREHKLSQDEAARLADAWARRPLPEAAASD